MPRPLAHRDRDVPSDLVVPGRLRAEEVLLEKGGLGVTVLASTTGRSARCPACGRASHRVHSRYARTLADLPWGGVPVRLRVRAWSFFCDHGACARRVFAERLGGVAAAHARRTDRQAAALELVAFALGGEAGARLAAALGLRRASPDTLLRAVRGGPEAPHPTRRVLGVDDWAGARGRPTGPSSWTWSAAESSTSCPAGKPTPSPRGSRRTPVSRW